MTAQQQPEFITRRQIPEFLARHGFQIAKNTLDQLSRPSRGYAGPRPAGLWNNRHLYRPDDVLRWAQNRFRSRVAHFYSSSAQPDQAA